MKPCAAAIFGNICGVGGVGPSFDGPFSPATAAPFSPLSLANLALWYRGDLGITLNTTTVAAWADQSGTGDTNKNLVQATGANQPTYNAADAAYSNRPTVQSTGGGAVTMATAGNYATSISDPFTFYLAGQINNGTDTGNMIGDTTNTFPALTRVGSKWSMYAGTAYNQAVGHDANIPSVVCSVVNGASSAIYANGLTASGTTDPGVLAYRRLRLFQATGFGKVAEILIYSGAHDTATRTLVTNYLGARYGIAIGA